MITELQKYFCIQSLLDAKRIHNESESVVLTLEELFYCECNLEQRFIHSIYKYAKKHSNRITFKQYYPVYYELIQIKEKKENRLLIEERNTKIIKPLLSLPRNKLWLIFKSLEKIYLTRSYTIEESVQFWYLKQYFNTNPEILYN
jgi:hypothetical protein